MTQSSKQDRPLELFEDDDDASKDLRLGFRLATFEVFNWGTFDGRVHSISPLGTSCLLIGENGAGKSTLVDAMLTLLVRPGVRNYNVAAGAGKKERDERTYIRGAYDRTAGSDEKPRIQYLREGNGYYTALLATFASARSGKTFTVCQVMYLTSSGDKKIYYGFDKRPRSIAGDLGDLTSGSDIKSRLVDRGFEVTESFKTYHGWIKRLVKFRSKAMDIFNQTVAVKDVQRLDQFIRDHMLEKKSWNDKVSKLLEHFAQLSEAHRVLVQVRQQSSLLVPILKTGDRFRETNAKLQSVRHELATAGLYFDIATGELLRPLCQQWRLRIEHLDEQITLLDQSLKSKRGEAASVEHEIQHSGGTRLQQLPFLIEKQEQHAASKKEKRLGFEGKLKQVGIDQTISSPEQLEKAHRQISQQQQRIAGEKETGNEQLETLNYELGVLRQELAADESELESLRQRKGNLPDAFIEIRSDLCAAFQLSPTDLPFAAELIAVDPDHRRWEGSIEQVLHSFARTLLVPDDLYAKVSGYVDSQRLTDSRGRGFRLTYDRVRSRTSEVSQQWTELSLPDMLLYRDDHPLVPYVRGEILSRFDHLACESIKSFQMAGRRAMTIHRHVKQNQRQHAKDDRFERDDRRHFVLGWDNRAKREALEEWIRDQKATIQKKALSADSLRRSIDQATRLLSLLDELSAVTQFDAIDDSRHDFEASQLRLEKQKLEASNDQVRQLKTKLASLNAEVEGLEAERDRFVGERSNLQTEVGKSEAVLKRVNAKVEQARADDRFETAQKFFDGIADQLGERKLTLENLGILPRDVSDELTARVTELEERLDPIRDDLTKAMGKLLNRFPVFESELDPTPQALSSFEKLAERINKDDLPRHERRFKQRLKEKVLQEIGLLHGSLEDEREEIRSKVETLNEALRQLDWNPGTFMRREPSDTSDAEIRDFRRELASCLEGTLSGTDDANEATFKKIEKLVDRLRDDANLRWREKVIDVRSWFKFAAREYDAASGEPGSYYDGGTGQSGGEKGKLAFLVLVAAIAYQYDLQPGDPASERFQFVMVDEMFSRSDDTRAKYALDLFERFGLQLAIVAPLDAKARITESYVGTYGHIIKDPDTHQSQLISLTTEQYLAAADEEA
ncbi:ATP-binding protein [Allorhodopirellula solitaria]|uniref:Chromosome partition protein Smc n=1 Tax=Allorhodopirellula solitaria TaxID=2527987 RepID=A0A5C5YK71_9BACT|nr:ATP-binding protein [Allorhodopirellula solitaria]TWT75300.1 Chromosome partition protein Smc [Allorhodopirellula solitaria]